jgi:hypothetical protein
LAAKEDAIRLKESAPARIITTASQAHQGAHIPFDDLNAERSYRSFGRYCETKLANILFTTELARRLEGTGVTANCFHPGLVTTGFNRNNGLLMNLGMTILRPVARSPETGVSQQDVQRKREQAARGLDGLSYFVLCKLNDEGVNNADAVCKKVREAFVESPNWRRSQNELRQLRQKVTFAIFAEQDDLDKVSALVDSIFSVPWRDKDQFKTRVREWSDKLGVHVHSLAVRPMRNKWASCSTAGNLNFSDGLLTLDRELADYVIVHEPLLRAESRQALEKPDARAFRRL